MRDEALILMGAILRGVLLDECFARELADIGSLFERSGEHSTAQIILNLSRHHRIKGMEGRARIGAMIDDTAVLHQDESKRIHASAK